jgi:hypothetical protein
MPSNNALVRQWKNRQNASLAMIPPLQTYLSRVYKRVEKAVRHSNTMSSLENGKLYVTLTGTLAPAKVFLPGSEEYQKSSGSYLLRLRMTSSRPTSPSHQVFRTSLS